MAEDQSAFCLADTAEIAQKQSLSKRISFARLTLAITSGWLASSVALPVHAATLLNNSGIQFDQDTEIESNFVESHGAYQSTFGVINLNTKEKTPLLVETKGSDSAESIFKPSSRRSHLGMPTDFKGTPGDAVTNPKAQYKFKANQRYVLYLESSYNGRATGVVYSTNVLNPNREQQVQFAGGATDLCTSGITVGWDDTGSKLVRNRQQQDRDFDDFIVQMKSMSCGLGGGEPPTVQAEAPPAPTVGALPPSNGQRGSLLWALPFAALPFLLGEDSNNSSGVSNGKVSSGGSGGGSIVPPPPPASCPIGQNCKAVPEPLTILGSGSAIAMAALMERRRKRKRK
ncbi:MAG: PEP-CTERM sorting domain-containing protein [Phormidium tanganyikae FI6-MK23]|nr:PEP-CTERM sorting domain-containing protein [Phormidium tanganyikae FI6-MK23]